MTLLALLCLIAPAHAGKRVVVPDAVEDALAYAETDRDKAIALLEGAMSQAKPKVLPILSLYTGEQHRLAGNEKQARDLFTRALTANDKNTRAAGDFGLVLLDLPSDIDAQTFDKLERADSKSLLDTQNAERHLLLAVQSARANDERATSSHSKKAVAYSKNDPASRERVKTAIDALLESGPEAVSTIADAGSGTPMERAWAAFEKGDLSRAGQLAGKALPSLEPESDEHLQATYLQRHASAAPLSPDKVAVLLPTSGKYASVSKQVLQALKFGYAKAGGTKDLVVYDTSATAEGAVAALERAVFDDGAIAVVGPLLSDSTDSIVRAASAMRVPLLSLSQANEVRDQPFVFQGVPSIGDQTDALVRHMVVEENMERFAIFAPDTPYGHRAAVAFRASVKERNGRITSEIFYDPKANALMPFASKLAKKNPQSRKQELWRLQQEAKDAGRDPSRVVLPPNINWQAIFIPDNARRIPIAAAGLAYEEIPIGQFRPRYDVPLAPLIGLSSWNHPSLPGAGGEYVRSSRFTDPYTRSKAGRFPSAFKAATGRKASSLEAVTSDAGMILATASVGSVLTRSAFVDALANASATGTATGVTGMKDHEVDAKIQVLTIDNVGILGVRDVRPPSKED